MATLPGHLAIEGSVEQARDLFAHEVNLRHIDWEKEFYLTTDASQAGCGAWLGQVDSSGVLCPVLCVSRKFNDAQSRYSPTRQELFAAMWAMQRLSHYLAGRHFFLRLDHAPIVDLLQNRTTALTQRWFDVLASFSFTPVYIPGPRNILADALSRQYDAPRALAAVVDPVAADPELTLAPKHVSVPVSPGVPVPGIGPIPSFSSAEAALLWEADRRGYTLPAAQDRVRILEEAHLAGHFGVAKTVRAVLNAGYWWPGLHAQVQGFLRECVQCMRFNVQRAHHHPLQSIEADNPWDHVQFDLAGPFPVAAGVGSIFWLWLMC